jgi:hypothetical protein
MYSPECLAFIRSHTIGFLQGRGHPRRFPERKNCLFGINKKLPSAYLQVLEKEVLLESRVYSSPFSATGE